MDQTSGKQTFRTPEKGRRQRERDLRGFAEQAARALMRGGNAHDAWVGWAVDVYDPLGRRRMPLPFADVPREGR